MGLTAVALHFLWQVWFVKLNDPASCLRVFRSNAMMGWLLFIGLWADALISVVGQL